MDDNFDRPFVSIRSEDLDNPFEIEIVPDVEVSPKKATPSLKTGVIDQRINDLKLQIDELDEKLGRLECHADGIDYAVAAACGVVSAVVDMFFVGEFSLEGANAWGTEKTAQILESFAKNQGASYGAMMNYAYHPSLFGLVASIVSAATGNVVGSQGVTHVGSGASGVFGAVYQGVSNWGVNVVTGGQSIPAKGSGLPGPILSLLNKCTGGNALKAEGKNATGIQKWLNDAYNGSLKGQNGVPMNLETELGIAAHVGKMAVPVLINEAIVRGFFFIRRFFQEVEDKHITGAKELKKINWMNTIPFNNRTVTRMMTVSTAAFAAVDLADAAVRAALKSGGNSSIFFSDFVMRINYIGVGRLAFACGRDIRQGMKLKSTKALRLSLLDDFLNLNNQKLLLKQEELWVAKEKAETSIKEAASLIESTNDAFIQAQQENRMSMSSIGGSMDRMERNNPGLKDEINDILKWE